MTDENGNIHSDDCFDMDGEAVFIFTVTRIPQLIKACLEIIIHHIEDVIIMYCTKQTSIC